MRYQDTNKIFSIHDMDITAAEAQGLATGMLCFSQQATVENWLKELWDENVSLTEDNLTILKQLFERTRKLILDDEAFAYQLFLPDDDAPLTEQMAAIVAWSEGFLFGVGFSQNHAEHWPAEIHEILQDIVEITRMDIDIDDLNMEKIVYEEHAEALMEIQEYLRTAVMLIKDYFNIEHKEATH
jgi:yecA family protein